jgi:hypothetical protein
MKLEDTRRCSKIICLWPCKSANFRLLERVTCGPAFRPFFWNGLYWRGKQSGIAERLFFITCRNASAKDAPGVTACRQGTGSVLAGQKITLLPHEQSSQKPKTFHIVVLKTTMTVPYTSVFLQLNCKYWSDEAEAQMRKATSAGPRNYPHRKSRTADLSTTLRSGRDDNFV